MEFSRIPVLFGKGAKILSKLYSLSVQVKISQVTTKRILIFKLIEGRNRIKLQKEATYGEKRNSETNRNHKNMVKINANISVTTVNVNQITSPILNKNVNRQNPTICYF